MANQTLAASDRPGDGTARCLLSQLSLDFDGPAATAANRLPGKSFTVSTNPGCPQLSAPAKPRQPGHLRTAHCLQHCQHLAPRCQSAPPDLSRSRLTFHAVASPPSSPKARRRQDTRWVEDSFQGTTEPKPTRAGVPRSPGPPAQDSLCLRGHRGRSGLPRSEARPALWLRASGHSSP